MKPENVISRNKCGKISLKIRAFSKIAGGCFVQWHTQYKFTGADEEEKEDDDAFKQLAKTAYATWELEKSYAAIIMVNHCLSA